MKQIWYLTGGLGSGKSSVLEQLAKLGADTISADRLAAEVRFQKTDEIRKAFGTDSPNTLREIVFNDPVKRHQLEEMTIPGVRQAIAEAIAKAKKPVFVAEMPTLHSRPDNATGIITVEANIPTRIRRACTRDRMNDELACKIIAAQPSLDDRVKLADVVLNNEAESSILMFQVKIVFDMMMLFSKTGSV